METKPLMESLMGSIASGDLLKAKKSFNALMSERINGLVTERKKQLAESVMIEGEEKDKEDSDEDDSDEDDEDDEE